MTTLTITSKGQITLKKDVLQALGVEPGDKVAVETLPNHKVVVSAITPSGTIDDLFGMFHSQVSRRLTVDEMNDIIADGWAGKR
ncbi:MAG: hypothetical protein FWD63_06155 [Propionibacteriaceae bacterium]|nr:hypothetical protein [Propionibacteriaceae bacterium]